MNIKFQKAKELVGQVARRSAPSLKGDYSFIMSPVLIKEVRSDRIIVKTLEGNITTLMFPDYDDDNWIAADQGISALKVAELWAYVRELKKKLGK